MTTPLRLDVADILHQANAHREVSLDASYLEGVAVAATALVAGEALVVTATLEHVAGGIVVRGRVKGHWQAPCATCLTEVSSQFSCAINELFEVDPIEGETYMLEVDEIDLESVVRDAVLPALPAAPHCREGCRGLCAGCGVDRNFAACSCDPEPPDPRWAALAELHLS